MNGGERSGQARRDVFAEEGEMMTVSKIPYRLALAGGWIDQPLVSRHDPSPPGSMVVVSLEPAFEFMDRSGLATSTRKTASKIWRGELPDRDPGELMREL